MGNLPTFSGSSIVRRLENLGFTRVGRKGSHLKLRKDDRVVIVPMHDEVARGTLASILRQAGITADDLRLAKKSPKK